MVGRLVVPEVLAYSVLGRLSCDFAEMKREAVEPSQDVVTKASGPEPMCCGLDTPGAEVSSWWATVRSIVQIWAVVLPFAVQ